jgi:glycerol uptake facilitator-like aquaporin
MARTELSRRAAAEALGTAFLLATVIGSYITSAYWFTASTSFANPAVTIARSFSNTFAGIAPGDAPAFIAAQFAGALLAHIAARSFWPKTVN